MARLVWPRTPTYQEFHRFIEQLELEGTSKIICFQPPCHEQVYLLLDQVIRFPLYTRLNFRPFGKSGGAYCNYLSVQWGCSYLIKNPKLVCVAHCANENADFHRWRGLEICYLNLILYLILFYECVSKTIQCFARDTSKRIARRILCCCSLSSCVSLPSSTTFLYLLLFF